MSAEPRHGLSMFEPTRRWSRCWWFGHKYTVLRYDNDWRTVVRHCAHCGRQRRHI